jgi:hypothetical protein
VVSWVGKVSGRGRERASVRNLRPTRRWPTILISVFDKAKVGVYNSVVIEEHKILFERSAVDEETLMDLAAGAGGVSR